MGATELQTLSLPTYDDNPSVGHPDVVDFGTAWNGYRYWMAFTPYPSASRENPSIVASNDGVTWVEPAGISNPVVPLAEVVSLGFTGNSDTDLVRLPDDTLALYYRPIYGTPNEGVHRKTSSDGVTWSTAVEVLSNLTDFKLLSPAVVVEADDSFTMWVVDVSASGASRLVKRTSADGVSWSAPTASVVIPSVSGTIWHVDVSRVGATYHALLATQSPYRLHHWISADGLTWSERGGLVPLSGETWDHDGHYRGCLVHVPDADGETFDIWVTGVDSPDANVFNGAAVWTVGYERRRFN